MQYMLISLVLYVESRFTILYEYIILNLHISVYALAPWPPHLVLTMKHEQFKNTDLSSLKYRIIAESKMLFHVQTEMNAHLTNGM